MEMLATYRFTPSIAQNMLSSLDLLTAFAKDLRSEVYTQSSKHFTQEEAVGVLQGLNNLASDVGQAFEDLVKDLSHCEKVLKQSEKPNFVTEVIQTLEEKKILTIRSFLNKQTNSFCSVDQMAKKVSRAKTRGEISSQGIDQNSRAHGLLYLESDLQKIYDSWQGNTGPLFGLKCYQFQSF